MRNSYVILDISGKVPYYEHALFIGFGNRSNVVLYTPYDNLGEYHGNYKVRRLIHLFNHKKQTVGRMLKAIEGGLNYLYFTVILLFRRFDVVHLQWLPYLEFTSFEIIFLRLFKVISPNTKFILTQHNLYPHGSSEIEKREYKRRLIKVTKYFDKFIVHTNSSKDALISEFNISKEKINVIYHGMFVPETIPTKISKDGKVTILMFGIQSYYKGTDILIQAVSLLPDTVKDRIEVRIVGKTDENLYERYSDLAQMNRINWVPKFLEDNELYQEIANADILVYPYRAISQSGALLLGLAFGKVMIASKLPSFLETLSGFPDRAFVEVGSAESLRDSLEYYICGDSDISSIETAITKLQNKYSWVNSADATYQLYENISIN